MAGDKLQADPGSTTAWWIEPDHLAGSAARSANALEQDGEQKLQVMTELWPILELKPVLVAILPTHFPSEKRTSRRRRRYTGIEAGKSTERGRAKRTVSTT